jgi:Bacterial Ig domain/Fibronectin type III domain
MTNQAATRRRWLRTAVVSTLVAGSFVLATPAFATTYFVAPTGADTSSGTSPSTAWRTVARVNAAALQPGDVVQFAGGAVFSGSLQPKSGAAGLPVTYTSYPGPNSEARATLSGGLDPSGHHSIFFDTGAHNLVFSNLIADFGTDAYATTTARDYDGWNGWVGGGYAVTFDGVTFARVLNALNVAATDHDWTVRNSNVTSAGLNGFVFNRYNPAGTGQYGVTLEHDTVTGWGRNPNFNEGKHGVYVNWTSARIAGNSIHDGNGGSGVSVRYPTAAIEDNTIYNVNTGVSYYDYAPASVTGVVRIAYNRMWNVASGIWIDRNAGDTNTVDNHQTFIVDHNDIHTVAKPVYDTAYGAIGLNWTSGALRISNNIVIPYAGQAHLRIDSVPSGGYLERNNWYDTSSSLWRYASGSYSSLAAYQSASGQGVGDLRATVSATVNVDGSWAQLQTAPSLDAGTSEVAGLAFTPDCLPRAYSYCGLRPDIGSVELAPSGGGTDVTAPSPPGLPAETTATATSVSVTWTAASDDVGVVSYEVSANGAVRGTTSSTSYIIGGLACGTSYTVGVVAVDAAGNRSTPAQAGASSAACPPTAPSADTTPPSVTLVTPLDGASVSRTFSITAVASDFVGVARLTLLVDDVVLCSTSAATVTCQATIRKSGWHTIAARAADGAGNTGATRLSVHIGRTA